MTFYERALEKETQIRDMLTQARDSAGCARALDSLLDGLLLDWNEACESPRGQEAASAVIAALRAALPLCDTAGEVTAWQRQGTSGEEDAGGLSGSRGKDSANKGWARKQKSAAGSAASRQRGRLYALLGFVLIAVSIIVASATEGASLGRIGTLFLLVLTAAGMAFLWLSGRELAPVRLSGGQAAQMRFETAPDRERIWRLFLTALQTADRQLEGILEAEKWEGRQAQREQPLFDAEELSLLSSLLEAESTGDGDFALETLSEVRPFLHKKGVELVDYSPEERPRFLVLPGAGRATIVPAMVRDGETLARGQATDGM